MSDEITMMSTTGTQEEVNQALGIETPKPEPTEAEKKTTEDAATVETAKKEETEHKGKPKKSAQERINELTREKYELKERLARLEGARDVGKKDGGEEKEAAPDKKVTVVPTRPKPDENDPKYTKHSEFTEDLAKWTFEQLRAQDKLEAAQKAQDEKLREKFDNFNAQLAEAREKHDDWDEIASQNEKLQVPQVFDAVIPDFENGAEMLYYVATHPEFRQKLLDLNAAGTGDVKIITELSRLSDYLLDQDEEKSKTASGAEEVTTTTAPAKKPSATQAPAPIKPVGGSAAAGATTKSLDQLPYQEYKRARRANR